MTARKNDVELACDAARLGAAVLLSHWEQLGKEDADLKSRNDWVSRADRESEAAIIALIREHCPNDAILGEEGGMSFEGTSGRTWIIDPLDGTSNYLQHFPVWSISIGLQTNAEITAGARYDKPPGNFFSPAGGAGAVRNCAPTRGSYPERRARCFPPTRSPFLAP